MIRIKKPENITPFGVVDKIFKALMWFILAIYCLSLLLLPIWMVISSFKDSIEYVSNPLGFPEIFSLDNYKDIFELLQVPVSQKVKYNIIQMFGFSFIYAFGTSIVSVFITTCVAYVISKYRFFCRNFIYNLGILVMIIPIVGSLPSAMRVKTFLHVRNNMFLTIITAPSCAFSGMNFLLLYGAFKAIPWDYAEAVFIDGGNDYTAYFKMYLPMILPTCTVLFVLSFLGAWNDYQTFRIWLPSTPNVAYALYFFMYLSAKKLSSTQILAGFTVAVIPTMAIYCCSQKLIMSKFTVGGLKG